MTQRSITLLSFSLFLAAPLLAQVDSAFTYQARVKNDGQLVNDTCTLEYALWDAPAAGNMVGSPITQPETITEGLFTSSPSLDFGGVLDGQQQLWLEARIQCPGEAGFTTMEPRQELTAAPFAAYAISAAPGSSLDAPDGDPTGALTVDGAGEIGIGISDPNATLHIVGNPGGGWGGNNYARNLIIQPGGPAANPAIGLFDTNNENPWAIANTGGGGLRFATMPDLDNVGDFDVRVVFDEGGNVGIGVGDPQAQLHIEAIAPSERYLQMTNSGPGGQSFALKVGTEQFQVYDTINDATPFAIDAGATTASLRLHSNGNVGIGVPVPSDALDVSGNIHASNNITANGNVSATGGISALTGSITADNDIIANGNLIATTGNVTAGGNVTATGMCCTSDVRFKSHIKTLSSAMSTLLQLRGVEFQWRRDAYPRRSFPEGRQLGFIAQELDTVIPEAVIQLEDGTYAVDYDRVVPVLVEGVKELKSIVDAREQLISDQHRQLRAQNQRLEELATRLHSLERTMSQLNTGGQK